MSLPDRIHYFNQLFNQLTSTTSLNTKRWLISKMPDEYKNDWTFILEVLNGQRKIGYKIPDYLEDRGILPAEKIDWTLRMYMAPLWEPIQSHDLSDAAQVRAVNRIMPAVEFIRPIVNREWRLGIGNSLLDKKITSPMLANKYDGVIKMESSKGYYITEKLDGNRCIAMYDYIDDKWKFYTRNGKERFYNIDMSSMPKEHIYDGEMLSVAQTTDSIRLYDHLYKNAPSVPYQHVFNSVSGQLNRKNPSMHFVYNIFDIICDEPYYERRKLLNTLSHTITTKYIRVVPVLKWYESRQELYNYCDQLLDTVTDIGAEGLMINVGTAPYVNKRGNQLLKYKKQQTMDMEVIGLQDGKGKYECMVGAIVCEGKTSIGGSVIAYVGSGLTDEQRLDWALHPDKIMNHIVEVAYFDLSQSNDTKGSNSFSLRFPRLKSIRTDKDTNENP